MMDEKAAIREILEIFEAEPKGGPHPAMTPKDASTLILIDRTGDEPRVLMGRRHHGHRFMPGKFVFPGGRIETGDRFVNAAGTLDPVVEEKLMKSVQRATPSRARALALACIRETFEETGIALGSPDMGAPPLPCPPSWGEDWARFAACGLYPSLEGLQFVARAITPPGRPKRFDTRFFAADASAIGHRMEGVVGPDTELVELVWIPLSEAETLNLPTITRVVLRELHLRTEAGFMPFLPVPFFHEKNGRRVRAEL